MSMVEINWRPPEKHLRQFGLIALVALPLVGWMWDVGGTTLGVLTAVGGVMALMGVFCARTLRFPFLALILLTLPMGMLVGELVLLITFFSVFVPMGLLMRMLGRDDLKRSFDPTAMTYWQPKTRPGDVASYLRQS